MGISLDKGLPSGIGFGEKGQTFVGIVVDRREVAQTDFATGVTKMSTFNPGQPQMQTVLTCITETGTTASTKQGPPVVDELARLFLKGHALGEYRKARNLKGSLDVGDRIMVRYVSDKPSDKGNPAKQFEVALKAGTPETEAKAMAMRATVLEQITAAESNNNTSGDDPDAAPQQQTFQAAEAPAVSGEW